MDDCELTPVGLQHLQKLKSLEKLVLGECSDLTVPVFENFMKALERMKIFSLLYTGDISTELLQCIQNWKQLEDLTLKSRGLPNVDISTLFDHLKRLRLPWFSLNTAQLGQLKGNDRNFQFTELSLETDCDQELADLLVQCPLLETLILRTGIKQITANSLVKLKNLKNIQLNVNVDLPDYQWLQKIEKLEKLEFFFTLNMTVVLAALPKLEKVRALTIHRYGNDLMLPDVRNLVAKFPNLERLVLYSLNELTDEVLSVLKELKKLRFLDVKKGSGVTIKVTDQGIGSLKRLRHLEVLRLPAESDSEEEPENGKAEKVERKPKITEAAKRYLRSCAPQLRIIDQDTSYDTDNSD
ncbi:MAG: hypothetical protein JWO53_105 [Chlamydiia bacterium]|nr:hypothetical protein [Chlamydiia bacterium]